MSAKPESKVELAKRNGRHLRGSIAETLASDATHFDHDDIQLLKFHGTYQQDSRDERRGRDWASRSVRARARGLQAANEELMNKLGRTPTPEEVATMLDVPTETVHKLVDDVHRATVLNYDSLVMEGDAESFIAGDDADIGKTVGCCLGSAGAWLGAAARIPFVAGIDTYLPPAFGRLHPKWKSPANALISQSVIAAVFIFLGQGGTTVKGAYEVLVSTTVLITMVPFLFVFASAIKLYKEPATRDMVRVPGGKATVVAAACIGLVTTVSSMLLSTIPDASEPNKPLAVLKVLGMTALVVGSGIAVFVAGRRREARQAPNVSSPSAR